MANENKYRLSYEDAIFDLKKIIKNSNFDEKSKKSLNKLINKLEDDLRNKAEEVYKRHQIRSEKISVMEEDNIIDNADKEFKKPKHAQV